MKTISFYSYKGGVGRSLALAYTARYLVKRNIRVCILDIDLEAPGVTYKFPEVSDQIFSRFGVVDYINFCTKENIVPDNIEEYFSTVPQKGIKQYGYIKIMSAGKGIDTGEYWNNLSEINWKELFPIPKKNNDDKNNIEQPISEGVFIFETLKSQIEKQLNPDYLLIDSRSGVTVMSIACNSIIPDNVIMLLANNNENFYGSALMYNHILLSKENGINNIEKIFCAITRFPESENVSYTDEKLAVLNREEDRELNTENKFRKIVKNDKLSENDISFIHSNSDIEDNEFSILHEQQNSEEKLIRREYDKLIEKIIDDRLVKMRSTLIFKAPRYRFIKFDLHKIVEDELIKLQDGMTYDEFCKKLKIDIVENQKECFLLYKRALCERYDGNIVESAMYLYDAIENAKENDEYKAHAFYLRGMIFLYDFNNYEYSIKDLEMVIKSFGRNINYHMAVCYYCLNRHEDAMKYVEHCFSNIGYEDNIINSRIYLLRAVINGDLIKLDKDKITQIIQDYENSISFDSNSVASYNCFGGFYRGIKENGKAFENYNKAIEINSNYEIAYYNRGTLYAKLNEKEKALADYDKAIEINDKYDTAYYNRGLLYAKLDETKKALADYDKAIEINDKYDTAYYNRGLLYAKLGEIEKAIGDFDRAIEIDPSYEEAHTSRAKIMMPITPIKYYKRLEIDFEFEYYHYNDSGTDNVDIERFPVKYNKTEEYYEFAIRKNGDRIFLSDQGKTFEMLDRVFELKEPDVVKNIITILKVFRVFKNEHSFAVEIQNENLENGDNKILNEKTKYRLFRCVSFMNKMLIFYVGYDAYPKEDRYGFTNHNESNTSEDLQRMGKKYSFPIKYYRIESEYEFELVKEGSKYFLSDQGKTFEMLDKVFELKEAGVVKNLNAIMKECRVLRKGNEFLIEINSCENTEINEAKYRLLECVSFMDTMRIFYV